ncbi:taste receptor type 2 member 7 [Pleuronectes platessa]|uniref:taste receptor type 2 member 7 n=1 Tax=Pleuronectes platessa TaxID=8262 RepID=UPI00232A66EA|nr:taste receptor type 2 member 7 [Pleuronectes platessa]
MERQQLTLSPQAFVLINAPLIFVSLTANIFYACCLISLSHGRQKLKQPLKTILECIVSCSILYCVFLPFLYYMYNDQKDFTWFALPWVMVMYFMNNSMTCYVRLNFYYYVQIVPARRALWIWVKRNIKSFMIWAFLFDQMVLLLFSVASVASQFSRSFTSSNSTRTEYSFDMDLLNFFSFYIFIAYIMLCLCVTSVSSFSTILYLYRHMRNVALSGSSFNAPRNQRHMRVATTGACQGAVYFLYATYYLLSSLSNFYSPNFRLGYWALFTVSSLFISGTTVNLGIGQTVFRQRAARTWTALKALCNVGVVTSDSQLTSG